MVQWHRGRPLPGHSGEDRAGFTPASSDGRGGSYKASRGYGAVVSFDDLAGRIDGPMFIVTVAAAGERDGCLVGFATQASIDPGRFLVCLSHANRTFRIARQADALAVHVVTADALALAELFGGETGDDVDKFARCAWREGPRGLPILDDLPHRFAGDILGRMDCGDHDAILLAPFWAESPGEFTALGQRRAEQIPPGHDA